MHTLRNVYKSVLNEIQRELLTSDKINESDPQELFTILTSRLEMRLVVLHGKTERSFEQ